MLISARTSGIAECVIGEGAPLMDSYLGSRSPRRLLAAAGAGMGLANGALTGIETDAAPPLRGAPPEVDKV
jgi:hypothetical protein